MRARRVVGLGNRGPFANRRYRQEEQHESNEIGAAGRRAAGRGLGACRRREQFIPVLSYRVGPYAAGGSGYYGGAIDYWTLVNMTGGINGVKLTWEECETEYNASKGVECYERLKKKNGGATTVEPLSTGIAYGLFDRVAQDKIPMTTFGYGLASSADGRVYDWVFPDRHDVLGPDGGDDRLPRPEGGRARQAQGQEDRVPVSRLGVRQGADPGARRAGARSSASTR